jgi:PAS domain S-box-containing protein
VTARAFRSEPAAEEAKPSSHLAAVPNTEQPVNRVASIPVGLLTPTGRDGIVGSRVLKNFDIDARVCGDMSEVCEMIGREEVGVLVIAEEALSLSARDALFDSLNRQPSWSDIPIILLTGEGELSSSLPRALSGVTEKGNVTLLERPVRVATLTTLIRSAQRARVRQLDVRDYIDKRHEAERSLRESEQRLRSAVLSAPYPLMLHAEDGEILQLSHAWTSLTGYDASSIATTGEWERIAFRGESNRADKFRSSNLAEGESLHLGERQVTTADGNVRTWDFHRVALGTLPDGRRLALTAAIDVTAYKQLVESERSARRQAEEANSAKSQFLATMSHELRTPLNAIAGYTQLLSLGVRGEVNQEQKDDLERIDRSQRHLLSLINDILNFAKIEAGHIAVENEPLKIARIMNGLKEFVEPQLREKDLHFSVINECDDGIARGDEDKVRQILINLLSNAIKFTSTGGSIEVHCAIERETFKVSVKDDGLGIPKDKLDAIFEPFVQVGRDFSSPQGGTGLGLAISRDLARRMGGELEVKSELGKGSTFTLSLRKNS